MSRAIFSALYTPMTAATVPLMIEQTEKGNYAGLLTLTAALGPFAETIAQGMHFSVVCSEDAPRISPQEIDRESAGTFLGRGVTDIRLEPASSGRARKSILRITRIPRQISPH